MKCNDHSPFVVGAGVLAAALVWLCATAGTAVAEVVRIGDNVDLRPSDEVALAVHPEQGDYVLDAERMQVGFPQRRGETTVTVTATDFDPLGVRTTALVATDKHGALLERAPFGRGGVATAAENQVRYANLRTGVDEVYSTYETRLKHELVLAMPPQLGNSDEMHWVGYEAELSVPASYELTTGQGDLVGESAQTLQFVAPNGRAPYRFPVPVARDAQGSEVEGHYVATQQANGTWRIRILFAADWLESAAYPVRLDPTVQVPAGTGANAIPFRWSFSGNWPDGSTYQQSYGAAQMTRGGEITEVGVQFSETFTLTYQRIEIRLGETSYNSGQFDPTFADNFDISGPVLVYDGPVTFDVVSNGFDTVTLTTPFQYSGNNNLLVEYRVHPQTSGHSGGQPRVRTGNQTASNWRNYDSDATSTFASGSSNTLMGAEFRIEVLEITQPSNNTIPSAYEGDAISEQFQADGGSAPYDFAATGLPGGVSMSTGGLLSGTLDLGTAGSHTVDVTVTDASSAQATIPMDWTIYAEPELSGDFPNATVGFAYSEAVTLTGGQSPVTFSLLNSTPSLPTSLSFDTSTGLVEGTPDLGDDGTYQLTIEVVDNGGRSDTHTAELVIDPPHEITLNALPGATDTGGYGPVEVTVEGGQGPFTFAASGLPAGLAINASTGMISGTVAVDASNNSPYSVTITVDDTNSATDQVTLALIVNSVPQLAQTLPDGSIGVQYSETFGVTGGTTPFTFDVVELPDGLELDATTGEVFGVPTHDNPAGLYELEVTLVDANDVTVQTTVELQLTRALSSGSRGCATAGTPTHLGLALLLATLLLLTQRRRQRVASA